MRIKKLELKNFRGFENLIIEFPESESGLAVFIGVNGAGKSSVLDAITHNLNNYLFDKLDEATQEFVSLEDTVGNMRDLNNGKTRGKISTVISSNTCNILVRVSFGYDGYLSKTFLLNEGFEKKEVNQSSINYNLAKIKDQTIVVYYATDRTVEKPELEQKNIDNTSDYHTNDSLGVHLSFNNFFHWFKNVEDLENQEVRRLKNFDYQNNQLNAVRNAIEYFLEGFKNPHIDRENKVEFVVEKDGVKLFLSNLSHGERLTLALIGDIARRLSIVNSDLANPLEGEGIVLIDEIELHLHPGWQRDIVPKLRKTFPNIQFILTTHSPQVLSKVPRENVFILEDFKLVENTPHTEGKDTNSILYEVFGVESRPAEATKEFRKLSRLIDDPNKLEEAKQMLKNMEKKYGMDDKEIVSAKMQLEFLND